MAKIDLPKVSIIIPVYNGGKYMREAIDSAISQTYENLEVVVVNDGSTDDGETDKIAKSYGNKIKYFAKKNGGVSTALNVAINNSTGKYISWLSHDDVYYHDKIEKQIEHLASLDDTDNIILFGDYDLIDEKSKLIAKAIKPHEEIEEKPEYALLRGHINGITLLIPKKAFDTCGLFDEKLRCTQDYELWQRMSKKYRFVHMAGIYSKSRQHSQQVSVTNPKVITEGDKFWTDLLEDITDESKIGLEGSVYKYYKEMSKFLLDTPYDKTRQFCEKKIEKLEKEANNNVNNIKVSVIIPFYNRKNIVINAIKSVTEQTHKNLEIIVINDGSKEDISSVKEYIKANSKITYIDLETNKGVANARNIGIEKSTGKYIAFLDSDDLFKENKIKDQVIQMELNNSAVSHTSYLRKGLDTTIIMHSGILNGKAIPRIIYSCGIATPTVMIRKDILNDSKYRFNTDLTIGEDTCFWLELLRNNDILGIDEPWTIVNVNNESAAYNNSKQILGIKAIIKYIMNDKDYIKYDYEISLLFKIFIDLLTIKKDIKSNDEEIVIYPPIGYCPNCIDMLNSRSWKITKPLRRCGDFIRYLKKHGLIKTLKKIFFKIRWKITGRK